jgi:hypothetical protein
MEYVTKTYLKEMRYVDAGLVQMGVLLSQQMNLHSPPYKNGRNSPD